MSSVDIDQLQSKQDRPMVIQQTCRIPEVRVFPPDSVEGSIINNGQSASNNPSYRRHQRHRTMDDLINTKSKRSLPFESADDSSYGLWKPFHMRPGNLTAFTACQNLYRNSCRTHNVAIQRTRTGWVSSAAKSLDLVRQNLQQHINKEISEVIKRYTDKFFIPAIENIKRNNGENSVSEEHIHTVCRQMLEDAKRMYTGGYARGGTPFGDNSDSETGSHSEIRTNNYRHNFQRKRKESDTDSEVSQITVTHVRKKGRPPLLFSGTSGRVTPSKQAKGTDIIKREGPKWDPIRITSDTMFIMGAKANKALGFAATRGRLYIKHPELFKYCGDSEDKQWLYENGRMPATGGKAYMLILEDIKELVESDEYRNSPGLVLDALMGFKVPEHMQEKIRSSMNSQRTDIQQKKRCGRPPNSSVENASLGLNIPRQQPFENKMELGQFTETEDDERKESLKTSQLELPESGLICDELNQSERTPDRSPYLISSGLNDADSNSDLQENLDMEPPLSAPFDITGCS